MMNGMNGTRSRRASAFDATATPSAEYLQAGGLPRAELEGHMLRGETPNPATLAGYEFRGRNTPALAKLLGIQKFIKGFYAGTTGQLFGYNIAVRQNRIDEPWNYKQPADPKRFGFYRIDRVDAATKDNAYLQALLLDYGRGGNSELDPISGLRDYLVRLHPGSDELLLGKAFYALGPLRIPTSYFILERLRSTDFRR